MPDLNYSARTLGFLLLIPLPLAPVHACERADVDYYLQRGFTHEQVVQLCREPSDQAGPVGSNSAAVPEKTKTPLSQPSSAGEKPMQQSIRPGSAAGSSGGVALEEQIYFKTVIEADSVDLSADALAYTRRGCIKYGEEDLNGFKEKACVTVRTTLDLDTLRVIRAQKGIPLIAERELIVEGDIQREVLDLQQLKPRVQNEFLSVYSLNPPQLNLPTRSGIDPRDVAARLRALSGQ
jgi:hypothetical protein